MMTGRRASRRYRLATESNAVDGVGGGRMAYANAAMAWLKQHQPSIINIEAEQQRLIALQNQRTFLIEQIDRTGTPNPHGIAVIDQAIADITTRLDKLKNCPN